jgi:3-deoxy-7-phosphoheptulonate synthase
MSQANFTVIAGPCSVESRAQITEIANFVKSQGVSVLRGGLYKMRTRPDSFQGLGTEANDFLEQVKKETGLRFISEVSDPRQIEAIESVVDMYQVGTRSMYNYALLQELGRTGKPVLLKRAFSALISEWVAAAEYIRRGGSSDIILCERGIRTFETATRNTLDLNAVAWLKKNTDYQVYVDPSHGTGQPALVKPMALAALAAGADGLLIEVHPSPSQALSDGDQALNFDQFADLMRSVKTLLPHFGRKLSTDLSENEAQQGRLPYEHVQRS